MIIIEGTSEYTIRDLKEEVQALKVALWHLVLIVENPDDSTKDLALKLAKNALRRSDNRGEVI